MCGFPKWWGGGYHMIQPLTCFVLCANACCCVVATMTLRRLFSVLPKAGTGSFEGLWDHNSNSRFSKRHFANSGLNCVCSQTNIKSGQGSSFKNKTGILAGIATNPFLCVFSLCNLSWHHFSSTGLTSNMVVWLEEKNLTCGEVPREITIYPDPFLENRPATLLPVVPDCRQVPFKHTSMPP